MKRRLLISNQHESRQRNEIYRPSNPLWPFFLFSGCVLLLFIWLCLPLAFCAGLLYSCALSLSSTQFRVPFFLFYVGCLRASRLSVLLCSMLGNFKNNPRIGQSSLENLLVCRWRRFLSLLLLLLFFLPRVSFHDGPLLRQTDGSRRKD